MQMTPPGAAEMLDLVRPPAADVAYWALPAAAHKSSVSSEDCDSAEQYVLIHEDHSQQGWVHTADGEVWLGVAAALTHVPLHAVAAAV